MLGLPYEKPAAYTRDYLQVLNAAVAGPGPVDIENDSFTVHNPLAIGADTPMPVLVAALGPVMLQLAGELADGTVLWMADERAIGDHIAPKITKAAADAGRPAPRIVAGIPVCLCAPSQVEEAKERANRILGRPRCHPTTSACSTAAMPATSATCARPATPNRFSPGCADSPTRA